MASNKVGCCDRLLRSGVFWAFSEFRREDIHCGSALRRSATGRHWVYLVGISPLLAVSFGVGLRLSGQAGYKCFAAELAG